MSSARAFLASARLGATHRFAWRFEVLVALVSAVAVVVVNASLWTAAEGAVPGLTGADLGTYTVVAWLVATAAGGRVEEWVGERLLTGEIAADLLRPMDLLSWALARHLGRAAASLFLTAVPGFALLALWVPVSPPPDALAGGAFLLSVALAAVVGGEMGFLVGLAAHRLGRVEGAAHLKAAAVWLLSGALVPIDALPGGVRTAALALPFQTVAHAPATLFLGRGGPLEAAAVLGVQAAWAVGLFVVARAAWGGARRRLVLAGG